MLKLKFSIHGSGIYIKRFQKNSHVWRTFNLYSESELNKILFNHDLFSKLNLKNREGKKISSYHQLIPDQTIVCYSTDRFTVLEIKIEGKRHGRIGFYDLVRSDLIFPAFPIMYSEFRIDGLNIVECDIGSFGSAILKANKFDIELLRFELMKIENKNYIHKIIYNDVTLEFKRTNTLNQRGFVLKQSENE